MLGRRDPGARRSGLHPDENVSDAPVRYPVGRDTVSIVAKGPEERTLSPSWSMDAIELPPGGLAAVFAPVGLPEGAWTLTATHAPSGATSELSLEVGVFE